MSVQVRCPVCKRYQATSNKKCKGCKKAGLDTDLSQLKKDGKIKYYVTFRINGSQKKDGPFDTREDAEARDGQFRHDKRVKASSLGAIDTESKTTFQELAEKYIEAQEKSGVISVGTIRNKLNRVYPTLGAKTLNRITPADFEILKGQFKDSSPGYLRDCVIQAKTLLNWGVTNDYMSEDSMRKLDKAKVTEGLNDLKNQRNVVLTPEQYQRVLENITLQYQGDAWVIGWHTGLRINNVLGLTWDRVDLFNRWITFEVSHRKKKVPKKVWINDTLHAYLKSHPGADMVGRKAVPVVQCNGYGVKDITRGFKATFKRARMIYSKTHPQGIIFHDLRHSSITHMRRAGVDSLVNMVWHGHSLKGLGAHSVYHTFDDCDLIEAGQRVERWRAERLAVETGSAPVEHLVDHDLASVSNLTRKSLL